MLKQHRFFNPHQLPICFSARPARLQSGAVMAISLIMLLLLTLIGITGTQVTGLEEKMAGNSKEQMAAFQAAEAALRAGETAAVAIATNVNPPVSTCAGAYYDSKTTTACPQPMIINWGNAIAYSGNSIRSSYLIEELDPVVGINNGTPPLETGIVVDGAAAGAPPTIRWYRITARGLGNTDNAVVVLQSTYTR